MEGAPIAIQEAMANGKVIIGSDIPGIRDQLKLFKSNIFKGGSIEDLYEKLNFFMKNSISENNKLGQEFKKFVINNYDISIEKNKIEKFYKKIIN